MGRVSTPRLHVVTDDRILAGDAFLETARRVLEGGGGNLALHLRGPESSGARLFRRARQLLPVARDAGARLVVNDRVDVALAVGADGVHLGRRSLPLPATRRLLGPGVPVGVSVHSSDEAREARKGGADYLFVGTIYPSSSHPDRPASGTRLVTELARDVDRPNEFLPVIAIGGMEPDRVSEVTAAGAHGVASISAIWDAEDPARPVVEFLEALGRSRPSGDRDLPVRENQHGS